MFGAAQPEATTEPNVVTDAPYFTGALQAAQDECYKIAFGVKSFDYQILGEHAAVMDRVSEGVEQSINQRDYFPRRPMLLPRLLQALNDSESTRRQLVNLIVEDPALP